MKINTTTWDSEDSEYASLELTTTDADEGGLTSFVRVEADGEVHLVALDLVQLSQLKQQAEAAIQRYAEAASQE